MLQPNWTPEKPYCIYKHIAPNGKIYIGQTKQRDLRKRWRNGNIWGYCEMSIFRKVINKYGWDNIRHEIIIDGLTKEEADREECKWISYYKQLGLSYNVSNGGDGCSRKMSEETKQKISKAHKGRKKGPHTKEWNENISKYRTGIKYTDIALQHIREAAQRRRGSKMSTEFSKKISEASKGRVWINNRVDHKFCKSDELSKYINNGWVLGRLFKKRKPKIKRHHPD